VRTHRDVAGARASREGGEEGEEPRRDARRDEAPTQSGWKTPRRRAMFGPNFRGYILPIALERQRFTLPRAPADDVEIFAVGDIHGRSDLLEALLDAAAREPRRAARRTVVLLGDLVDRGADSLGAIELGLEAGRRAAADEAIALMGNHEAMMRMALDASTPASEALAALETWMVNGGDQTLAEFLRFSVFPADLEDLLADARRSAPAYVVDWLEALRSHWRSGGLLFVHAGVNPDVDLEAFLAAPWNAPLDELGGDRHWAWVRRPFLSAAPGPQGYGGYFVVHGHTPNDLRPDPSPLDQIRRFRLNLDTGSVMTGVAAMGIFRGTEVEVVKARGPSERAAGR